jgi:transposase-like protein
MATRAPLTEAEKEYIYERKQEGASLTKIGDALGCAYETARKWWRHQRDGTRPRPKGRPRRGILSSYPAAIRERAIALKRAHPHWGPANVNLQLKRELGLEKDELPSSPRLAALFKAECPEAVQPRQRRLYPEKAPTSVTHPHQRWQVDGKEKVAIGDNDVVTILNARDPVGALMIASRAFVTTTPQWLRKLTLQEVKDTLRQAFTEWGLPLEIQTDRETVYVGAPQETFPSLSALWLIGLGIQHIVSRDRRPTDQAHVERSHRTVGDMAWKDQPCATVEQLQSLLDDCRQRYNEELPVQAADCQGRPPLEVRPWARHSGRPFHSGLEWTLFNLQRVDAYLACQVWIRKVSAHGEVHIGRRRYQVGCINAQLTVSIRFCHDTRCFRFQSSDGTVISERLALGLDKADIIGHMPFEEVFPLLFQLPFPLRGYDFMRFLRYDLMRLYTATRFESFTAWEMEWERHPSQEWRSYAFVRLACIRYNEGHHNQRLSRSGWLRPSLYPNSPAACRSGRPGRRRTPRGRG